MNLPKSLKQDGGENTIARILAVVETYGLEGATRLKIMGEAFIPYETVINLLPIVARAGLIS
jgi:hypothetical protein